MSAETLAWRGACEAQMLLAIRAGPGVLPLPRAPIINIFHLDPPTRPDGAPRPAVLTVALEGKLLGLGNKLLPESSDRERVIVDASSERMTVRVDLTAGEADLLYTKMAQMQGLHAARSDLFGGIMPWLSSQSKQNYHNDVDGADFNAVMGMIMQAIKFSAEVVGETPKPTDAMPILTSLSLTRVESMPVLARLRKLGVFIA